MRHGASSHAHSYLPLSGGSAPGKPQPQHQRPLHLVLGGYYHPPAPL